MACVHDSSYLDTVYKKYANGGRKCVCRHLGYINEQCNRANIQRLYLRYKNNTDFDNDYQNYKNVEYKCRSQIHKCICTSHDIIDTNCKAVKHICRCIILETSDSYKTKTHTFYNGTGSVCNNSIYRGVIPYTYTYDFRRDYHDTYTVTHNTKCPMNSHVCICKMQVKHFSKPDNRFSYHHQFEKWNYFRGEAYYVSYFEDKVFVTDETIVCKALSHACTCYVNYYSLHKDECNDSDHTHTGLMFGIQTLISPFDCRATSHKCIRDIYSHMMNINSLCICNSCAPNIQQLQLG
jgi:hypothetical protein